LIAASEFRLKGKSQMSPSTPTRQPWTVDEQKKLDDLLDAGKTVVEIAPVLQRTRQAVYARLQRRYRKRSKPSARWPIAI
jgi:IS30 family transposase